MKKLLSLCLIISLIIGTVPLIACGGEPQTSLPYGRIVDTYIQRGDEPLYKNAKNQRISEEEALQLANTEVVYYRVPLIVEVGNYGADGWMTAHASCNLTTLGFHQDAQNEYAKTGESAIFKFAFYVSMTEWISYQNEGRELDAFTVQAVNVADLAD
jgi:hypothetical protein